MGIPIPPGWRLHPGSLGRDNPLLIEGLNPFEHRWHSLPEPPILVPHPQYPEQVHDMSVVEIRAEGRTVRFAAGEFSNGAWGFYLPDP